MFRNPLGRRHDDATAALEGAIAMLIDLHAHAPHPGYYNQHPHWGPFFEQHSDGDIKLRVGHWILGLGSPDRKAAVRRDWERYQRERAEAARAAEAARNAAATPAPVPGSEPLAPGFEALGLRPR